MQNSHPKRVYDQFSFFIPRTHHLMMGMRLIISYKRNEPANAAIATNRYTMMGAREGHSVCRYHPLTAIIR